MISVPLVLLAGIALSVVGMMLVIGGVLSAGLFLPGVVLIGLGLVAFAGAGVLSIVPAAPAEQVAPPRPGGR